MKTSKLSEKLLFNTYIFMPNYSAFIEDYHCLHYWHQPCTRCCYGWCWSNGKQVEALKYNTLLIAAKILAKRASSKLAYFSSEQGLQAHIDHTISLVSNLDYQ